jgi:hypothetical protein
MPRKAKEPSPLEVRRLLTLGCWSVGGVDGLALRVTASGPRSWVLRLAVSGKQRDMGLGSFPPVTLATAREKARAVREPVAAGVDQTMIFTGLAAKPLGGGRAHIQLGRGSRSTFHRGRSGVDRLAAQTPSLGRALENARPRCDWFLGCLLAMAAHGCHFGLRPTAGQGSSALARATCFDGRYDFQRGQKSLV